MSTATPPTGAPRPTRARFRRPGPSGSTGRKPAPPTRSGSAAREARVRRQASLVPVAGLAALAGFAYHRVFGMGELAVPVAVSATAPVLLALLCSGTGPPGKPRPLAVSLLLSGLAWCVAVTATVYRDDATAGFLPSVGLMRSIGSDVLDAPRGILTTVLPAPSGSHLMVLASASVWLAGLAGAELALRTDVPVLPALPGLLLLTVPVVLTAGAPGGNVILVTVTVTAVTVLLVCRAPGRRSPWHLLLLGAPWIAVLAVIAGFAAPRMPGVGTPPDVRAHVTPPPPVPLNAVNPLDRVSEWLLAPDQPLFSVRGPASPDRYWRLTVLDTFDGTTWYPVDQLRPTGGRVPEADLRTGATTRAVQEVTLSGLDGVWLPAADRPTRVNAPDDVALAVDPDTGALATGSLLQPGTHYEVVSSLPHYDPDRIQRLPTVADPAYTSLPERDAANEPIEAVEEFRRIANEATAGSQFPYQQALRLADWLRSKHHFDRAAVPGHSYFNLRFFLEKSKEGTSEQFASAFAILGRTLGLPTRVVVGFSRGSQQPDGSWRVDSGNVVAWPEVRFAEVGWVPFYPTPGEAGLSGAPKNNPDAVPGGQQPKQVAPAPVPPAAESRAEKDAQIADADRPTTYAVFPEPDGDSGTPVWWWAVPAAALLALMLTYGGVAVAAPGVARRRRAQGPPAGRVFGAWHQITDRLTEIGMPGKGVLTVREVAAFGDENLPDEVGGQLWDLADVVNDVAYGGRPADTLQADAAWRTCASVEAAVRASDRAPSRRARFAPRRVVGQLRRKDRL